MQVHRFTRELVATALVCYAMACSKGSDDKEEASAKAVTMSGQLILNGAASPALADTDFSAFKLVCETVGQEPQSCDVSVAVDGSFSGSCANFAEAGTACTLQEDGKNIGKVVFNEDPIIATGNGTVEASITIDRDTGDLTTRVDEAKSSALEGDKTKDLPKTTWTKSLAGKWLTACSTDSQKNAAFHGASSCPDKATSYIASYDASKDLYSFWQSQSLYEACVPPDSSGTWTESHPHWHVAVGGDSSQTVELKFSTQAELEASLDAIYAKLPAKIKTSLDRAANDISGRASQLKSTVDLIRASTSRDFGGVVKYRVPSDTELTRRLTLHLLQLDPLLLEDTEFCGPLILDETLLSMYRRTHSLEPELVCRFRTDAALEDLKTFSKATAGAACRPQMFYDVAYDSTSKTEDVVLKCVGSSAADGACFEADGNFAGQIAGRFSVMELSNRVQGAFDLYQKRSTQLQIVHPKLGLLPCKIQTESVITAFKDPESDDHFQATVSNRVVNRCEGSGASEDVSDWYGGRVKAAVKRLTKMFQADFTRAL